MAGNMSTTFVAAVVCCLVVAASGQSNTATMQLQSGKVIDLYKAYQAQMGKCCVPASAVGADGTPIVRMDHSGGAYYVTNDPNCRSAITSSAYPVTFSYVYLCGQCKGGCPAVDGGKTLVLAGQPCRKPDGGSDITKQCVSTHPVCSDGACGKCSTLDEAKKQQTCPSSGCNRVCPGQVNNAAPCSCGYTFCFGKCTCNDQADKEWTKNGQTPPACQGGTTTPPVDPQACPTSGCNRVCPNQVNNGPACSCGYTFCFGKCSKNDQADKEWTKNGQKPPPCKGA